MAHQIAARRVLYEIPGMQDVEVRRQVFSGSDAAPLDMAIYMPADHDSGAVPATVIVEGYSDRGFSRLLGCRFMDMGWSVSTAQLIARSGIAAITYANRRPAADASALLDHLMARGGDYGIDAARLGLWATSGHGPVAHSILPRTRCAVLVNAYLCDLDGATHVADAANMFRFEAPASEPAAVPQYLVRSGRDEMPGLNASLDRFVGDALSRNHPVTIVNHPDAPHAFDLLHDSHTTRTVIRQALDFLRAQLDVST